MGCGCRKNLGDKASKPTKTKTTSPIRSSRSPAVPMSKGGAKVPR